MDQRPEKQSGVLVVPGASRGLYTEPHSGYVVAYHWR